MSRASTMMPINLTCPLCHKSNGFHNVELLCNRVIELTTSTIQCPLCSVVALNIQELSTHLRDHKTRIKPPANENEKIQQTPPANSRHTTSEEAAHHLGVSATAGGVGNQTTVEELEEILNDFTSLLDERNPATHLGSASPSIGATHGSGVGTGADPECLGSSGMSPQGDLAVKNGSLPPTHNGLLASNCEAMHHGPTPSTGRHPIINASRDEISGCNFPVNAPLLGLSEMSALSRADRVSAKQGPLLNNGLEMSMDGLILSPARLIPPDHEQMQLQGGGEQAKTSHYHQHHHRRQGAVNGNFKHCIPAVKTAQAKSGASSAPCQTPGSNQHPPTTQCEVCGWNFDDEHFLHLHTVLMHGHPGPNGTPSAGIDGMELHPEKLAAHPSHPLSSEPGTAQASSLQRVRDSHEEYSCRFCDEIFTSFEVYKAHLRSSHNDHRFICKTCGKLFKLRGSLLVHERVVHNPNGQGTFHCSICNRKFNNKYRRDIHERSHKGNEAGTVNLVDSQFTCPKCHVSFNDKGSFEIHMASHRYHCQVCSQGFETNSELVLHSVSHMRQGKTAEQANNACEPKEPRCGQCAKVFPTEVQLGQHMKLHTGGRHWECKVCQKTFTTKYFLKKHNRLHTGETPYKCNICQRAFTFQQSFHKHMLYHSDEKPYTCSQCGRSFKELSTLQNHERIHSGERPFQCETCGKSFRQRVSYLVHRRIHTGVMPYKCDVCGKSFRYKVTQRTHKCPGETRCDSSPSSSDQQMQMEISRQNPNFPSLPPKLRQDLLKFRKVRRNSWHRKSSPSHAHNGCLAEEAPRLVVEEILRFSVPQDTSPLELNS